MKNSFKEDIAFILKEVGKQKVFNCEILADLILETTEAENVIKLIRKLFDKNWKIPVLPNKKGDRTFVNANLALDVVWYDAPREITRYFQHAEDAKMWADGKYVSDYRTSKSDNYTFESVKKETQRSTCTIEEWCN